jgi:predicted Fe-Mo cluster-binding NifX family protein
MKIAIPTADGRLCSHFGHCETFTLVTVEDGAVKSTEALKPPPHEPGVLPRWLHGLGVNVIIAGGMGHRAQEFFGEFGIQVVVGAQPDDPANIVRAFLDGALQTGENVCDH